MTAKRLLDLALVLPGLVLAAPLMLLVALLVRLGLGPGVIFRQTRPGLDAKPFTILKFRTMRHGPGPDAERLTPLGRLLRRTSLDELPELWNVARGDMSLVGPRPLLMEYLPRYSPEQARRHEVRPGITGLAQVRGRNALSWEERLALDVWYVDNRSLGLDLRILGRTVLAVLSGRGVSAPGQATMSAFTGTGAPPSAQAPAPRKGQSGRD
ncbi:Sugar transferase involved in LPS biosynthesis (colanic, teichoic acid) [Humidesulfovibrio mexicanus]|uniref:Sugar transferase involved in LPS biosynthesis (Colanic, teichoic acid) n=1 Tax=Humidesulfovibrio mexicanus TaxID=147047 RepID=A0A239BLA1_9BACT|nr:sugar transferase [Humidesulfovibrio mexicanus]SNS08646.1 Sugar transferase involved in LPS biosynthesis (colanic, teichoic acid) [Humidesulfovibrio mexicanus]